MIEELEKEEEALTKKEKAYMAKREAVFANYGTKEEMEKKKVEFLGQDKRNFYLNNPANEQLMIDACNECGLDIEVRAFSDIYLMDVWSLKPLRYTCQLKRITGKDSTNPRFKDAKMILYINGDVFYSSSIPRRKYMLIKELSRLMFNIEKEEYKILKFDYNNNRMVIDQFGALPTEEQLKAKFGEQ